MAGSNNNLAENGDFNSNSSKRGRYHITQREWAKREIRNLLIFGYTNDEISDKLHIPKRTLERYLHDMFVEDIHLLDNASREQLEEQVQRFRLQLAGQLQDVLEIAHDKNEDGGIRMQAHELACEIGYARMNMVFDTPARVARALGNNHFRSNKLVESQKGLEIKLVKNQKDLPHHYEIINNGNGKSENNNNNTET